MAPALVGNEVTGSEDFDPKMITLSRLSANLRNAILALWTPRPPTGASLAAPHSRSRSDEVGSTWLQQEKGG
jgi:hypothetical protein